MSGGAYGEEKFGLAFISLSSFEGGLVPNVLQELGTHQSYRGVLEEAL